MNLHLDAGVMKQNSCEQAPQRTAHDQDLHRTISGVALGGRLLGCVIAPNLSGGGYTSTQGLQITRNVTQWGPGLGRPSQRPLARALRVVADQK